MSASDKDWVERCLDWHPDDYRHLVERYQGVLLSHLRGRLDEGFDPEDAAQETFVVAEGQTTEDRREPLRLADPRRRVDVLLQP